MRVFLVVVLALLIVGLIVALAVVPSCEDRGGQSEFSHFQPVMIGPVINLVPVYDCVYHDHQT